MHQILICFFFQAEDGIRDFCLSRGLGDVYKRQAHRNCTRNRIALHSFWRPSHMAKSTPRTRRPQREPVEPDAQEEPTPVKPTRAAATGFSPGVGAGFARLAGVIPVGVAAGGLRLATGFARAARIPW